MKAIFWKELADHFGSWRFIVFVAVIVLAAISTTYTASETILDNARDTDDIFVLIFSTSGEGLPDFIWFIALLGPFLGIIFGFDVINGERTRGTLSRIISQPVYRDSVINAKFLAGLTAIGIILAGIILISCGLGLYTLGITPDASEIMRILIFYFLCLLYVGFWLGLGILCSVFFKHAMVSVLVSISIWIFFMSFMSMIAGVISEQVHPVDYYSSDEVRQDHDDLNRQINRVSPVYLFEESSDVILTPEIHSLDTLRQLMSYLTGEMIPGSISVRQSLVLVWPHIVTLIALTSVCFAASYIRFMREEIRAT